MTEAPLTDDYFEETVLAALLAWPGAKVQHFFFEGKPVPLARQRSAVIRPAFGKPRVVAFSPKQNIFQKDKIYCACLNQKPIRFEPPYTVALKFICEPLKSVREEYPVSPTHGDLDNLQKLIFDSLFFDMGPKVKRNVPVYRDDRHIVNNLLFKRLPGPGERPGIHFWMVKP